PEEARAANLPPPDIKDLPIDGDRLTVILTATGEIYLGDRAVPRDRLRETVQRAADERPGLSAVLMVDNRVAHGDVVKLIDLLKQAGIEKISLAVRPDK
ncbi:MAG TPA: biopolymer transporter ExbD, partial [Candidatus Nanopelagicales bacterium]|nr:biopolymer transporter ExbD [Candidatus Nanopelagicales bacterium]